MNNSERAIYASAWNDVIEACFIDIIKYMPDVYKEIDVELPYEFLNQDFEQIRRDIEMIGEYTSKLVRVWLNQEKEDWILLHLHVQAEYFEDLPGKMFIHSGRIFQHFKQHSLTIVILCDEDKNWRPDEFSHGHEAFGTVLRFRFGNLKLLDFNYNERWQELEKSDNLFANVIMAHLKALETLQAPSEHKIWKTKLTHRLYEKGLESQDIRNLYKFIDKAFVLPEPLQKEFWEELKQFETERNVTYITKSNEA